MRSKIYALKCSPIDVLKFESPRTQTRWDITLAGSPCTRLLAKRNFHCLPFCKEIMRNPILSPLILVYDNLEMYRLPIHNDTLNKCIVRMEITGGYPGICYCPLNF